MRFLAIGDIYAKPGRQVISDELANIIKQYDIDFVIANGENATHGKSLSEQHAKELFNNKINVITSGNHIFKLPEVKDYIGKYNNLLRPLNIYEHAPGKGYVINEFNGIKIMVVNLMGRNFMDPVDSPYSALDNLLKDKSADIIIVDFHAEATGEKKAFAYNYDGKITAFLGTHTHVQTADEQLLEKGTLYISDLGMTGDLKSVIGAKPDSVIQKEKYTIMPTRFIPADGKGTICALAFEVNNKKVTWFERVQWTKN